MPATDNPFLELEQHVAELQTLLMYAPRAFVIEFAGTPKSGKSTSVEAIRHFFSRHGFRVHVLAERAALCPIPMKGHLFFNTWCATSMLAELLANVDTETDIVIVDRGIFDALVWLTLQEKRGELTATEARTFEAFLLLERWRSLIDLSIVMTVSAKEALSREVGQRLTKKTGSITNEDVLSAITESVDDAMTRHSSKFDAVIKHDTTGHKWPESGIELARQVLDCLGRFLNPEILVVPRVQLEALPLHGGGAFGDAAVHAALDCISRFGSFMPRAEAESRKDYVQVIPCGLICHEERVFLFRRKESDPKSKLFGTTTLWQGCHTPKRDGFELPKMLANALSERVQRSLFLSRVFPLEPFGYCWERDDEHSAQHFGVVYRVKVDNAATAIDLRKKEFRTQRGHSLSGQFYDWETLSTMQGQLNLEPWSRAIVQSHREKN